MDNKTVTLLVQKLFAYPEGPYVLDWLQELYQQYPFRHIVQSNMVNANLAMAYKAGQSDVITFLVEVSKHGLPTEEGESDAGDDRSESDTDSDTDYDTE